MFSCLCHDKSVRLNLIQDEKALALNTEEGTCFLFHRAVPELALKSKH